ncbi:MAG: glucose 1-dehydrogenase [Candidatus Dormibacteraeota bacterium]|nr:glucose 1-dehydrogenase [Candidatus Dormibacteraeota bacterium]
MKALAVVPGRPESAGVVDVPEPPPTDGSVLVATRLIGICGTDAEIVVDGYGWPPPGEERLILGHESLGQVIDAPESSGLAPGDLVVGIVRRPDPVPCACCARGEWDMCRNGRYVERGIKELHGYGSERYRIDPAFAVKVDGGLGDLGVLLEPTSVLAKAWEQAERIGARSWFEPRIALVTGAGPIGLLAALLARQRGLETHVADIVEGGLKAQLVREIGATYHAKPVSELPVRPDVVIECTGIGEVIAGVVRGAASNAVVALAGISARTRTIEVALDAANKSLVMHNQVIFGTVNAARRHYEQAAEALAAADRGWLGRLITRRLPLERWPEALQKGPDDIKVVVELGA